MPSAGNSGAFGKPCSMGNLAEQQRTILHLLKGRAHQPIEDPYLAEVARSPGFAFMREIALFWRTEAVEATCRWTSRLLKRLGTFDQSIASFYSDENVSPYKGKAGEQFLVRMSRHGEPLIAAMAKFELAFTRIRQGAKNKFRIEWDRDPDGVFRSLITGKKLPPAACDYFYRMYISRSLRGLVKCNRVRRKGSNGQLERK
jgi:hypothetical protein